MPLVAKATAPLDLNAIRERHQAVSAGLKRSYVSAADVPALLAEVERLRAALREIVDAYWSSSTATYCESEDRLYDALDVAYVVLDGHSERNPRFPQVR